MKCHYCGAEVTAREIFCRNCGTKQIPAQPAEGAPAVQPAQPASFPMPKPAPTLEFGDQDFVWQPYQYAKQEPVQPEAAASEVPEFTLPGLDSQPETPEGEKDAAPKSAYVPYGAPLTEPVHDSPRIQLPTGRSLAKMFFLGIITLGIYPTVIWSRMVTELNLAASRYDGLRTMSYFGMCLLTPFTLCIYPLVWMHCFSRRVGAELERRSLDYKFGAKDYWLWNVLGSLILVGPFVFVKKLTKSMNLINEDFNKKG